MSSSGKFYCDNQIGCCQFVILRDDGDFEDRPEVALNVIYGFKGAVELDCGVFMTDHCLVPS